MMKPVQSPVLFIPHGGGPLPLLADKAHEEMVAFLKAISRKLVRPSAIVVISAHWQETTVTITGAEKPPLLYDYSGFPDKAYEIEYAAKGSPQLAAKMAALLTSSGIDVRLDNQRGFDHGVFVPLKIMFPAAQIPCVQISLLNELDPQKHIDIGKALSSLRDDNILILGSGFSFHNMAAFFHPGNAEADEKNLAFEHWLRDVCTNDKITESQRKQDLLSWSNAPFARYCHPSEEHLMPLHVCYGCTNTPAKLAFAGNVLGKTTSAFIW
ncbi:MAG: dioxygenase [Gammaproteobacteria bacterium]|nr:dioxygenase [Gammaproteobacteria bacterium]